MDRRFKLLLIDDSADDGALIGRHLKQAGFRFDLHRIWEWDAVCTALTHEEWHLIICDHRLPTFESGAVLEFLRSSDLSDIPLILVSGIIDVETAVSSMRSGANDFLSKDDLSKLGASVQRELEQAEVRQQKLRAEAELYEANRKLTLTLQSLASTQEQLICVERFRALGQMASGIAHDFNNSLTKMLGITDLLGDAQGDHGSHLENLRTIISDAAAVVRRLSDFYREGSVRETVPMDVNSILEEIREFTKPHWQSRVGDGQASIELEVEGGANCWALAEASQLREILTNLIFNSCDAIPVAGKISLTSREKGNHVEIEVKDNGDGMTPEVLSRCLDPLYSTKGENGTGMGLSIVDAIVQAWKGAIRVKSEPGKGTSVTLVLQKPDPIDVGVVDRIDSIATVDRLSLDFELDVLVVDDEPIITSLLKRQLEKQGHRVVALTDPVDAAEMVSARKFDLVISDRSMPQMSGDDLAVRVKEVSPDTAFVMATGFGDLMITNSELPKDVDLILPKPIEVESLNRALQTLFGSSAELLGLAG